MKIFYIANDDFHAVGHPRHTLRSLFEGNTEPVVLLTQPQHPDLKTWVPGNCKIVESLPTTDAGREISPSALGASIAEQLIAHGITSDDLVVLKMPFPYLLLAVTYALSLTKISLSMPRVSVLISQTDEGYISELIHYSDCFAILSKLPQALRDRFALLHEREILRQHWLDKFPLIKMGLCGYVTEWFTGGTPPKDAQEARLAYLGEARGEKGFNTLADVISTGHLTCGVMAHCDANTNNINEAYHTSIKKIQTAHDQNARVELVHQKRENNFEEAFHTKSVALMLYSPEYRIRGSGILQECAAAGMHVIAYEDLGFHLDYPANVMTVHRTSNNEDLARDIEKAMTLILTGQRKSPAPNVLTASDFRTLLTNPHDSQAAAFDPKELVFVFTNNVHREGCSKIIEAQQEEIVGRKLTPVFISFEWPDLSVNWSEKNAFDRVWRMQMNAPSSSYGYHYLTIPLVNRKKVLEEYKSFQYKELLEISENVNNDILDVFLSWRSEPVVVMNYLHHLPILDSKLKSLDQTFLEIHDITSIQQRIRANDLDERRFEENLTLEVRDLNRFKYKYALSSGEADFLAKRSCDIGAHSYMDVFLRSKMAASEERKLQHPHRVMLEQDYLCIIGSGHPSNVVGINEFCGRELENTKRTLPILICGRVCQQISYPQPALEKVGIHLLGYVEDIGVVIANAIASLNPVDIGSGTPIKVYESIAYGTPCLATRRTLNSMPAHPLVIEFDFNKTLLTDELVRQLATDARSAFAQAADTNIYQPNKLGTFLDEHCSH